MKKWVFCGKDKIESVQRNTSRKSIYRKVIIKQNGTIENQLVKMDRTSNIGR